MSWGHCYCLRVKQSPSEGRERKQRASHGTSQEQGWLPQPPPHWPPFCWEVLVWPHLPSPLFPSVPRYPLVTSSSMCSSLTLIPENVPFSPKKPFEWVWHVKGFRMSDFSWHNLCQQRWHSFAFCCAVGHLSKEEIAFQHISLIRIMWYCSIRCKVPCCWESEVKLVWRHPHMNHVGQFTLDFRALKLIERVNI